MTEQNTKDRILDVAEKLFADNGFAATSLRGIIKEAGVNSASVHYHFGSREGLVEAVIARRAAPVNQLRLEMLDELEATHPRGKLPIGGVVRAFVIPPFKILFEKSKDRERMARLMSRAVMESSSELREGIQHVFAGVIKRFVPAFQRAVEGVAPQEIMWRVHFMLGAMAFSVAVPRPQDKGRAALDGRVQKEMIGQLISFCEAGMCAPVSESEQPL